jgi:hypothetical protein
MATTSKPELLENVKKAIDVVVSDPELDDDTKEEILEEVADHLEDSLRMLSGDDDEDEEVEGDEEDEEVEDDEEDEEDN